MGAHPKRLCATLPLTLQDCSNVTARLVANSSLVACSTFALVTTRTTGILAKGFCVTDGGRGGGAGVLAWS